MYQELIFLQVLYFLLREKHKSYSLLEDRRVRSKTTSIKNQFIIKISEQDDSKKGDIKSLTNFEPLQSPVSGSNHANKWSLIGGAGFEIGPTNETHLIDVSRGSPDRLFPNNWGLVVTPMKGVSCLMHFYNPTHHCDYCS